MYCVCCYYIQCTNISMAEIVRRILYSSSSSSDSRLWKITMLYYFLLFGIISGRLDIYSFRCINCLEYVSRIFLPSSSACSNHSTNFFIWSLKTVQPREEWVSLYHFNMPSSERTSAMYKKWLINMQSVRLKIRRILLHYSTIEHGYILTLVQKKYNFVERFDEVHIVIAVFLNLVQQMQFRFKIGRKSGEQRHIFFQMTNRWKLKILI